VAVQLLVILVPVIFALMGFAVDLGRLYLIRGELKAAANATALAAAQRLVGTDASTGNANNAAVAALSNTAGQGNKYDFGGIVIGSSGFLTSEVPTPAYYELLADATSAAGGGAQVGGAAAKYARVEINAEGPLVFWGFLSMGQARKTPVVAAAVAGMSAPLCTACNIEPLAVAAVDPNDTTDFGFIKSTRYTFTFQCTGTPTPAALAGAGSILFYMILNRWDEGATLYADENSQLYRDGAQGLPGSSDAAKSCFSVNAPEQMWASAQPIACSATTPPLSVSDFLCGMASRFDPAPTVARCVSIPEVDTMSSIYTADTDITDLDDYATYTGSTRRVITIPIVDALAVGGTMTVLGFRQFLVEPNQNDININPADSNGRFVGLYIGSVMPLRQGRFDACQITAGPGKVVLHQ
jgi:hypothetical protein